MKHYNYNNKKRTHPPIWQHDYHVLRRLNKRLQFIIKQYIAKEVDIILDYGCGDMPYKDLFLPKSLKYIGVDVGENKKADILIKENQKIPLEDSSVDVIVSTQVLEHVEDNDFYLSECRRLLKKDGLLIISTHGVWPYHLYPVDFHRWTKEGLKKEIKKSGFKLLEIYSVLGPFASATQFVLVLVAERLINQGFLARFLLALFSLVGNGIIFIEDKLFPAQKSTDASLYIVCARK